MGNMTNDLISRQDVLDAVNDCGICIQRILDIPSAEPERKTGEWIDGMLYVNSHWKVCSECHVSAPDSCGGYNFCPNCGAEMRGDR